METRISSSQKEVVISDELPVVLIGERINPAGRKRFQEALKANNFEIVREEALAQAQAGADILDVCVATFGGDEESLLPQAVQLIMATTDLPLCLDSANPRALEAALKVYKGKALVNSVTGEKQSLESVLPLIKEYNAAVIALVQDDEGIPKNSERRIAIAHNIVEMAESFGIPREDIIIDCLISSVGADSNSAIEVLKAIQKIKSDLGVNITLGASNVSFGLPNRTLLNNAFIVMAMAAGATSFITDAEKTRLHVLAADLLLGKDKYARRYIEAYHQAQGRLPVEKGSRPSS